MTIEQIRNSSPGTIVKIKTTEKIGKLLFTFRDVRQGFMCVVKTCGVTHSVFPSQIEMITGEIN